MKSIPSDMKKSVFLSIIALLLNSCIVFAQSRETRNVDNFTKISFRLPGKLYLRQGGPQKVEIQAPADVLKEIETKVEGNKLIIGREGKWFDWSWNNNGNDKIVVYITVASVEGISVAGSGDVVGETKVIGTNLDLNVSGSGSLNLDTEMSGDINADVSGSGDIDLKLKCKSFDSDVSGSGRVLLSGNVENGAAFGVSGSGRIQANGAAGNIKATISGSGKVLAANMETNRCDVRISGSGDVEINVKDELDANISGSGSVAYKGNPSKVNSHASGSGHVRKM
jgi:hypothetical protein